MKAFFIFLLLALLITLLATFRSWRGLHYDDPPFLNAGRRVETVVLALDPDGLDKLNVAWAEERNAGAVEMLNGGRFFVVKNGTMVTVLETGSGTSRVRIREDGREAYVRSHYIRFQ